MLLLNVRSGTCFGTQIRPIIYSAVADEKLHIPPLGKVADCLMPLFFQSQIIELVAILAQYILYIPLDEK